MGCLEWFCEHKNEVSGRVARGREALDSRLADLDLQAADREQCKLIAVGSLEVFARFSWMLTSVDKARVPAWIPELISVRVGGWA